MVLSPAAYKEKVGLATLRLMTSQVKGYPFDRNHDPYTTGDAPSDRVRLHHIRHLAGSPTHGCAVSAPWGRGPDTSERAPSWERYLTA